MNKMRNVSDSIVHGLDLGEAKKMLEYEVVNKSLTILGRCQLNYIF